jgi:dTDP-4-amino-4,6-dideoxygalactose transaminase
MGTDSGSVVPLLDLRAEYEPLRFEVLAAVDRVFSSGKLYLGPETAAFEEEFAAYCGAAHGVAVSSGTDALLIALQACDIGPGDEVITVSHTFIATVAAIALIGAKPVFVDIDPRTYTVDPELLAAAVTPRTRAILPVHLYGHPAQMDAIEDFAGAHGLAVIEDAAQAHGARYRGRPVGGIGDAGCFSFVFTKNLRAYGDAGIIVTDDTGLAERARRLRDHGRTARYEHATLGWNARIDEVQAAILRLKLPLIDGWAERRREHARAYRDALTRFGVALPFVGDSIDHAYHQYVIQVEGRDDLRARLADRAIETGVHYPIPCHLQSACAGFGFGPGSLPHTEAAAQRVLSLPVYPELSDEQRRMVIECVSEELDNASRREVA